MRDILRFILAWAALPVLALVALPMFMLLDYVFEENSGIVPALAKGWVTWATMGLWDV